MALQEVDLSRFPYTEPLEIPILCEDCGDLIEEGEYCEECALIQESEEISQLSFGQFMSRLDELFDGDEKDFYPEGGEIKLKYLSCETRLARATKLLEAYGAKYLPMNGCIEITVTTRDNKLELEAV